MTKKSATRRQDPPANVAALQKRVIDCFSRGDCVALEKESLLATSMFPQVAFFWKALGVARNLLGQRGDDVVGAFRRAVALNPQDAESWDGLSQALVRSGKSSEALDASTKAAALSPQHPMIQTNYGNLLADAQRIDEAIGVHQRAIQLAPGLATAWNNLGSALRHLPWQHGEAEKAFRHALALDPTMQAAWDNLLFLRQYQSEASPSDILRDAVQAAARLSLSVRPRPRRPMAPLEGRPLRVGWVSADFRAHAVGHALLAVMPHFAGHGMEIFVYNNAPVQDTVSERLQICATRWRDVACFSDEALTDVIEADGVDILVDLSGLTRGHRLGVFARRAAPVQVCWLGWFSTTGLPQFDWYLGDRITLPVAEATAFVERLWRIEGPYYVQSPRQLAIATDAASLDGPVRFGCFNALAKLSMRTLDLWGAILRALPDASLFLRSRELGNRTVCAQLRAEFVRRGVTEEQLVLEPGVPLAEYLGGFSRIDVSLDPSPYTGGATSFDSLWMGVPVLTLAGDRFIAHQGETLLTAVGLTDWIAQDEDDYVRKAIDAAARTGALRQGRCELRQRFMKSPLVDGERLAAQLVAAWQGMARAVVEPLPERPLSDDPQVLEPLAALLLHLSDRSQAIRVLSRLVEVATDPIMRTDAQRRLTLALQEAIP